MNKKKNQDRINLCLWRNMNPLLKENLTLSKTVNFISQFDWLLKGLRILIL